MNIGTLVRIAVFSAAVICGGCGETSEAPRVPGPPNNPTAPGVLAPLDVPEAPAADVRSSNEGNAEFALDLYAKLRSGEGNVVFSPHSISTALAMTYAGARNNTEEQMARVLHFRLDTDRLLPALANSAHDLAARGAGGKYQLAVANKLWGQSGYRFLSEFLDLNARCFGARLQTVDFARDREKARMTINAWVEEQTQQKIKDLLSPDNLNPETKLVLTNAIYFKGSWLKQFDARHTRNGRFSLSASKHVDVPMMHQRESAFLVGRREGMGLLELPYVGSELAMLLLLPHDVAGLSSVEKQLNGSNLKEWLADMRPEKLAVSLPKFKVTQRVGLAATLSEMGMPDAFGSNADFSGMDGTTSLLISAVIHKAFVDVNEEGTEAAAATAVVMRDKAMPRRFVVNRPFIFVIRDRKTGSILFIGRVANPLL